MRMKDRVESAAVHRRLLLVLVRSESGDAAASSALPVAGRAVAAETAEAIVVALPFEKLKRLKLAGEGTLISP
jgi:hypothetical protein